MNDGNAQQNEVSHATGSPARRTCGSNPTSLTAYEPDLLRRHGREGLGQTGPRERPRDGQTHPLRQPPDHAEPAYPGAEPPRGAPQTPPASLERAAVLAARPPARVLDPAFAAPQAAALHPRLRRPAQVGPAPA